MYIKKIFIIFIFSIFIGCSQSLVKKDNSSGIRGTIIYNQKPQNNISVFAYKDFSSNLKGNDYIAYFDSTGNDGGFSIKLPQGNYIIVARSKDLDDDFFGYYGGNPVTVINNTYTALRLGIIKKPSWMIISSNEDTTLTGIYGMVLHNNSPLAEAKITAYLNSDTFFRGLGFAETFTDSTGNYNLSLPIGTYFIVAHKRNSPDEIGPLNPGDYFGYYINNPLELKKGFIPAFIETVIKGKGNPSESVITASGTFAKKENYIKGKIIDINGNPISNVFAGLYSDSNMIEKPIFMSDKTDNTGEFKIFVSTPGIYFLGARDKFGAPPKEGEYMGWYVSTPDHSINISSDEKIENIKIIVDLVPASGE